MKELRYTRVLLKVSGELLGQPAGRGISIRRLKGLSKQIAMVRSLGAQIGIVVGGGNILRGAH
ncbi:MAG: UMP kinase, partial [Candidatus Krumholzibacteria bacterium]|nr:UMP kinase [Candidatus Krumholzibacteria bacterium]